MNVNTYHRIVLGFISVCSLLLLSACGFHLRGTGSDAAHLPFDTLYIETQQPYNNFNKDLLDQLRQAHVTLVNSPTNAQATLVILSDKNTSRDLSVGGNGQTHRVVLNQVVTYQLRDPKGRSITDVKTAQAQHFLTITQDEILGSNNDKARYQREMSQMCARQILVQLQSQVVVHYFQSSKQ